jgi:hypothetical protein
MADVWYNSGKQVVAEGKWPTGVGDIRMLLIGGASVPGGAYATTLSTVSALLAVSGTTECNGTGYSRKSVTGRAISIDAGNSRVVLDSDDVTWTGADFGTVRAAVLYVEGASDAARTLIAIYDTGFPKVTNSADLTIGTPNGCLRF